ncbi:MAG TPA: hypothetical protein VM925_13945 [Labilithrix sp.]|nr:hypothetical protein [Labilithrix sp.]
MYRPSVWLSGSALVVSLLSTSSARADEDCPPGSVHKTQDSFSWCEPTVCTNDGQCKANEVCRPVGLCLEVGTLADAATGDGPKRLVVTQRCAPDKTCPQKQTCSDMSRCITKAAAEKIGVLNVSAAPSATPDPQGAAKKSCGCDVVGRRDTGGAGAVGFGLALSFLARRRRRNVSRPRA